MNVQDPFHICWNTGVVVVVVAVVCLLGGSENGHNHIGTTL